MEPADVSKKLDQHIYQHEFDELYIIIQMFCIFYQNFIVVLHLLSDFAHAMLYPVFFSPGFRYM